MCWQIIEKPEYFTNDGQKWEPIVAVWVSKKLGSPNMFPISVNHNTHSTAPQGLTASMRHFNWKLRPKVTIPATFSRLLLQLLCESNRSENARRLKLNCKKKKSVKVCFNARILALALLPVCSIGFCCRCIKSNFPYWLAWTVRYYFWCLLGFCLFYSFNFLAYFEFICFFNFL